MKKTIFIVVGILIIADLSTGRTRNSDSNSSESKPKSVEGSNTDESELSESSGSKKTYCKPEKKPVDKDYRFVQQNCALEIQGVHASLLPLQSDGTIKPKTNKVAINKTIGLDALHICIQLLSKDEKCTGVPIKLKICDGLLHLHIEHTKLCVLGLLQIEIYYVDLRVMKESHSKNPKVDPLYPVLEVARKTLCGKENKIIPIEIPIPKPPIGATSFDQRLS